MVQIVGIAASMNHLGDVHHGRCPGRSVDGHILVRVGQQAVVVGMEVADEDGIGILSPFEGLAADLLLLLLGPGVEIERQTQIEQDFSLPGSYLNTTAADFVCSAVDNYLHSSFSNAALFIRPLLYNPYPMKEELKKRQSSISCSSSRSWVLWVL